MVVLPFFAMRDGRFYKFWVYIMGIPTGTLYIGMTGSLDKRIGQQQERRDPRLTKKYGCVRLLYYKVYSDIGHAKRRERQLKGWRRERKIALIEKMNPRWEDLAEHWGQEMCSADSLSRKLPGRLHRRGHILGMLRLRATDRSGKDILEALRLAWAGIGCWITRRCYF